MNIYQKVKLGLLLKKINKQAMWEKLNKSELWVTAGGVFLLSLLTQIEVDPELANKIIGSLTVMVTGYVASRGLAKAGKDTTVAAKEVEK